MRLLIATTNRGKIREIVSVLGDLPIELVTLADLSPMAAPDESGATFAENAAQKATAYWRAAGLPAVAEDSGLEIDALGGRPGVESARYPGATYPDKFQGLYRELAPHPQPWTARFVCALAFVQDEAAPCGSGYDPIFYYPPYGTTLADVSAERKLAVAHRGRAFREFRAWLARRIAPPPGGQSPSD